MDSSLKYSPVRIQPAPISNRRDAILTRAAGLVAKPSVRHALASAGFALAGTALRVAARSYAASRQHEVSDARDAPWVYIERTIVYVSRET